MAGTNVIIIGGVSVNDVSHDGNPFNFINPAVRLGKKFKTDVQLILYTPSYERRVTGQKKEHSSVTNPQKKLSYFKDVVSTAATQNKFTLTTITTAAGLTTALKAVPSIATLSYYGHSNVTDIFLEYSSITAAVSKDTWGESEAKKVPTTQFAAGATFASYGCNQGDPNGLCEQLRQLWKIPTVGSVGKTDFSNTGPFGGPMFPTSASGYVQYPAPSGASLPKAVPFTPS